MTTEHIATAYERTRILKSNYLRHIFGSGTYCNSTFTFFFPGMACRLMMI
ncbi:unnamed protein product [Haemonchus placei]|uniref:Uncharacterized protein n=1 Tax=Haemonchus placei TaxID=6290 RepID=A0A158QRG7_HAEPC|nr:unnamed protein product [Haemonchus placei]